MKCSYWNYNFNDVYLSEILLNNSCILFNHRKNSLPSIFLFPSIKNKPVMHNFYFLIFKLVIWSWEQKLMVVSLQFLQLSVFLQAWVGVEKLGVWEVKREMKKFVDILSWVSPEYVFTSTLTNTEYSKERNAKNMVPPSETL